MSGEVLQFQPFGDPTQHFTDSYFAHMPVDVVYQNVRYQRYFPQTTLQGTNTVTINLPGWGSPTLYKLSESLISCGISIVQDNGEALPLNTQCAPCNNILQSAFSEIKVSN